jgi:hypothetical protein
MPTCQFAGAETKSGTFRPPVIMPVAGPCNARGGKRVVDEEDQWATLSGALGEALLDVERTFINVVERHGHVPGLVPYSATGSPVRDYFDAKLRLDDAHRELADFLVGHGRPLKLLDLRCVECSQELR